MQFNFNILFPILRTIQNHNNSYAFYIDGIYYTYRQLAERISAIRGVIRRTEKNEQIWDLAMHHFAM